LSSTGFEVLTSGQNFTPFQLTPAFEFEIVHVKISRVDLNMTLSIGQDPLHCLLNLQVNPR